MAFIGLDTIRTGTLNPALGITLDTSTDPWYSNTIRNAALQDGFAKLWPTMGRLYRESITVVANQVEYTLTSIYDVETIEVLSSTGVVVSKVDSFRVYVDESASGNAPVRRLLLPRAQDTAVSLRAIGYAPYIVPTPNTPPASSGSCDLPDRLIFIPVLGAIAYLYRAKLMEHMNAQQFQNENRATAETVNELQGIYQVALQQYAQARDDNRRNLALPKAANLRR